MDEWMNEHVTKTVSSCFAAVSALKKIRNMATKALKKQLVEALVVLKFCKWGVLTLRSVEPILQEELLGKCCRGAPFWPPTRGWISVSGASGREDSLRSLMF